MNGNTALAIAPAQAAQAERWKSAGEVALAAAKELVVDSPEGERRANEWLGLVAQSAKQIETIRVAIVAPFKKITSDWDRKAREAKAPLTEARSIVEDKLRDYRKGIREEQERKQREFEEARRLKEEAESAVLDSFGAPGGLGAAGEDEEVAGALVAEAQAELEAVPEVAKTLVGSTGMTSSRMDWTFEITDPDQVPRQFCVPDERLIRAAVKAGLKELAGVRIYEKEVFAHRGW